MNEYNDEKRGFLKDRGEAPVHPDTYSIVPAAAEINDDTRAIPAVPGHVPLDFSVRSVFATRPVNGYDFIISNESPTGLGSHKASIEMTVPLQKIAVLDKFQLWIDPMPIAVAAPDAWVVSLYVNGNAIPGFVGVLSGYTIGDVIPCYLVAGPSDVILISVIDTYAQAVEATRFLGNFMGSLLLSTGLSPQYEIANPGTPGGGI